MKFFWKKTRSDYYFTAIELRKVIPELKNVDIEHIESHLRGTNLEFYKTSKKEVTGLIRFRYYYLYSFICDIPHKIYDNR